MITVASVLWDANAKSEEFSRCYSDIWATRLFNGFRRNLHTPSRSVLFTNRPRDLPKYIEQIVQPDLGMNGYGDCVRPFELNDPMIFAGLDTVVVGNVDKLARWCIEGRGKKLALPKHPYEPWSINGIVLVAGGQRRIFDDWCGENDMKWMRSFPHDSIDTIWPGKVVSYKAHVRAKGGLPPTARIVYFHGPPKMDELGHEAFIREAWR